MAYFVVESFSHEAWEVMNLFAIPFCTILCSDQDLKSSLAFFLFFGAFYADSFLVYGRWIFMAVLDREWRRTRGY